jgi:hypothetical protein
MHVFGSVSAAARWLHELVTYLHEHGKKEVKRHDC